MDPLVLSQSIVVLCLAPSCHSNLVCEGTALLVEELGGGERKSLQHSDTRDIRLLLGQKLDARFGHSLLFLYGGTVREKM